MKTNFSIKKIPNSDQNGQDWVFNIEEEYLINYQFSSNLIS